MLARMHNTKKGVSVSGHIDTVAIISRVCTSPADICRVVSWGA